MMKSMQALHRYVSIAAGRKNRGVAPVCASLARLAILQCAIGAQLVIAQNFPSKPIRIIVPYTAGGTTDVLARALASPMSASLGQQIVVENRPGGSSIIGMVACAKAAPDGYTLCMTVADSLSYNPHVIKDLPYDADKDFVPVINLVRSSSMLFAKANAPFGSLKEMITYARSKPGAINWATWGPGSIPETYMLWIKHQTGADITGIAYKGSGPSTSAVLAGEVDVTYMSIGAVLPHIKSGKAKPLAVIGRERSPLLPGTPSLAEEGVDPGLRSYFGVFAPAKTPRAIVDRLNLEFAKGLQSRQFQELLRTQTLDAVGGSAAEFAQFLIEDRANAGRVFKAIGVRPGEAPK